MNVFATLSQAGRQWPTRPALIDRGGSLDYRSLWSEIGRIQSALDRLGVSPGQGVGIRARNGREFVIGALAALGCGAVVMPIHHQLKPAELEEMLKHAPLSALLEDADYAAAGTNPTEMLAVSGGSPLRFSRRSGEATRLVPWVEDAAFIRFTSGTTGASKGVILTHRGVLERTRAANTGLQLGEQDTVLWILPMAYHLFVSILLYLEVGATIVISPDHLPETVLEEAARHAATFFYAAPMHIRILAADQSKSGLPSILRRVMSVSSRLHPHVARSFLARYGVPVTQGYGVIELGLPIINATDAVTHPEAIGRPLPGFEVEILSDDLQPVGVGKTGQLAVRGPGMFAGYLSPAISCSEVLRAGWFLTGDLAHRDSGGLITIDGRSKSVINVAGHKVFPEDIAAVLEQHPAVLRSRVTTRPHPQLGEVVHAEVQLRENRSAVAADEILGFCRRQLSSFKVPASIDLVSEIDLTPSGKVRYR